MASHRQQGRPIPPRVAKRSMNMTKNSTLWDAWDFDFGFHEHTALFVGPALHYGAKRWWATFSWAYQAWGKGVGEPDNGQTFAEEARNEYRLKLGFNF